MNTNSRLHEVVLAEDQTEVKCDRMTVTEN